MYSLLNLECHSIFISHLHFDDHNLQSQSRWSFFNETWQKRPGEWDQQLTLRFEGNDKCQRCPRLFFLFLGVKTPTNHFDRNNPLPTSRKVSFWSCPHIQPRARGPTHENQNQFLGTIQVVFQERPPQNNLKILKEIMFFSRGVLKSQKKLKLEKNIDSGVNPVNLKYCRCTTCCSTSQRRDRYRSRDNDYIRN